MGGAGASSLRLDSMGLVFPPGAPLRRGGVYPLKAGGAELRASYMARRDVWPRSFRRYALVVDPTYLR